MKTEKVIEGILHLLNPNLMVPWSADQFSELFLIVLKILSELAPVLNDVFLINKGSTSLLLMLERLMKNQLDQNFFLETLSALCRIVTCENNLAIIQDLKEQYAMKTILGTVSIFFQRKKKFILFIRCLQLPS